MKLDRFFLRSVLSGPLLIVVILGKLLHVKQRAKEPEGIQSLTLLKGREAFSVLTNESGDLQRLAPLKNTAKELREFRPEALRYLFSAGLPLFGNSNSRRGYS